MGAGGVVFIGMALAVCQATPLLASGKAPGGNAKAALRALIAAKKAARTGGARPLPPIIVVRKATGTVGPATPFSGEKDVNGRRIHRGADLRGADLRWADLRNCDLRGARLEGADLTGARLQGALCQGAAFQGARLFMADLSLADDLDLKGAQIHPFFQDEGDKPGTLKFLATDAPGWPGEGPPRSLVCAPGPTLYWLEGTSNVLQRFIPTGCQFLGRSSTDSQLRDLALDAKGRLWSFGDRT
jgi:hypothetical protein